MTAATVCPYCRGPIEAGTDQQRVCDVCGTQHHADCYEENGGCTVFGCSSSPAEEPELNISRTDLAKATRTTAPAISRTLGLALDGQAVQSGPTTPSARVKAPPPPMPPGLPPVLGAAPTLNTPRAHTFGVGSVLFGSQPVSAVTMTTAATSPVTVAAIPTLSDFVVDENARNRTTFIVLGVLLGLVGAHNFYAGYRKKAITQLCITIFSAGFAAPMIWVWAVIEVCTVDRDSEGKKFRS
jgi:hypothetical protein